MRICFFANMGGHANWHEMFDKVEFYRIDIRILKELGHKVVLAPRIKDIDWNADLFFCWWWGYSAIPVIASLVTKKPCIVTGAFDYATCREELPCLCYLDRPIWQKKIIDFVLNNAAASLFVSEYEFKEVVSNLKVKQPILAPHAVDVSFYKPRAIEEPQSNYFFTVSWTSRTNVIRKGLIQSIEAFASLADELPCTRFKIAGKPGDYHGQLEELAYRLGVQHRVDFLGMISDEEKRDHYQRCLAYVQPTLYEGFGLAIAEAIACGSRVVTSDRGAVPEVAGNFGICVPPKDVKAIAAAMLQSARTPYSMHERDSAHHWIKNKFSLEQRRQRLQLIISNYG